jgi:hypothetical protein
MAGISTPSPSPTELLLAQVSRDTVKRDWRFAKLWLLRELSGAPPA